MEAGALILDFGSQYTQLIARRVRELGVYSEIHPFNASLSLLEELKPKVIILSGGPASVRAEDAPQLQESWLKQGLPVLGICYGMQLIGHLHGASLGSDESREYGHADIEIVDDSSLFKGISSDSTTTVWMSHGDHLEEVPEGFELLARSSSGVIAALGNTHKKFYALQFHPEVAHTEKGELILSNFLFDIGGCEKNWDPSCFISKSIEEVKAAVPEDAQVICGLSGGVDSTVAASLVSRAIGSKLHCIFVNNGLLRKNEAQEVQDNFGPKGLGFNLHYVDATELFLERLKGIVDPEQKRKIIGRTFIEVFDEEAHRISDVTHLVQGTLYPDVIESVSVKGPSVTIKTHHNVGGLPEAMKLKLIEPLRELFKDEVRAIGRELEIPQPLLSRHPFPGPGLAVRILGDITEERLRILRESDFIYIEEIKKAGLYDQIWQAFAVLLPIQSVGVMGDSRTYEETIALRAVVSTDGMTASWFEFPPEVLRKISNRIINEVPGINRVTYDISSKPPATIEWE